MAYESAAILFGSCDAGSSILVRLEGTCARAHQGPKTDLARRAKVGYCPCCARAAHVAAPTRYTVREFSDEKARGLELWRKHGPWAARRSAAYIFSRSVGYLPCHWDGAARSLVMFAPPPFVRIFEPVFV